jgi:hypothetical protein
MAHGETKSEPVVAVSGLTDGPLNRHSTMAVAACEEFGSVSDQTPPAGPQWVSRLAPLQPHALANDKPLCASQPVRPTARADARLARHLGAFDLDARPAEAVGSPNGIRAASRRFGCGLWGQDARPRALAGLAGG